MRRCAKDRSVSHGDICLSCQQPTENYPNYQYNVHHGVAECALCLRTQTYRSFASSGPPCNCHLSLAAPPPPSAPVALTSSWVRPAGTSQFLAHREWNYAKGQCSYCGSTSASGDCTHLFADRPDIGVKYGDIWLLSAKDWCVECGSSFAPTGLGSCPGRPAPAAPAPQTFQQAINAQGGAISGRVALAQALAGSSVLNFVPGPKLGALYYEESPEPVCECGAASVGIKPGQAGHALDYCPVARKT